MKNKKFIFVFGLVSSFVCLVGFGSKIELINANKPFIELGNSGGAALSSAQSFIGQVNEAKPTSQNQKTVEVAPKDTKTASTSKSNSSNKSGGLKYIEVEGSKIEIDGKEITTTVELNRKLEEYKSDNATIIVKDNYAESDTMKELMKSLENKGLEYTIKEMD